MDKPRFCGSCPHLPEDGAQVSGDAHARHIVHQQRHGIHNQNAGNDAAVGDHLQPSMAGGTGR